MSRSNVKGHVNNHVPSRAHRSRFTVRWMISYPLVADDIDHILEQLGVVSLIFVASMDFHWELLTFPFFERLQDLGCSTEW